jgi:microcystin-dependent protein
MANQYASNKTVLVEPPLGSYVDQWNVPVNSNFGVTDAAIGGTTTINVTTLVPSSPFVTLVFDTFDVNPTPWQNPLAAQNLRILLNGAMSFNITVYIPQNKPGFWIIDNQTTGNFSISVVTNAAGSTGITAPQGKSLIIFSDGVNVKQADSGIIDPSYLVPTGAIMPFAASAVPTAWLYCDGSAVSRTTYASLFSYIGTTWGAGDGLTTFNLPDFRNMFLRGNGSSAVATYEGDTFTSHNHGASVYDPGHNHTTVCLADGGSTGQGQVVVGVTGVVYRTQAGSLTTTSGTGISVGIGASGSSETRPVNRRVLYCIKT